MKQLSYSEFLATVSVASGTFSYKFAGLPEPMICNPAIYIARNWPNGLPAVQVAT